MYKEIDGVRILESDEELELSVGFGYVNIEREGDHFLVHVNGEDFEVFRGSDAQEPSVSVTSDKISLQELKVFHKVLGSMINEVENNAV